MSGTQQTRTLADLKDLAVATAVVPADQEPATRKPERCVSSCANVTLSMFGPLAQ